MKIQQHRSNKKCRKFKKEICMYHFPSYHRILCIALYHLAVCNIPQLSESRVSITVLLYLQLEPSHIQTGSLWWYHSLACHDLWRILWFWFHFWKLQPGFCQRSDSVLDHLLTVKVNDMQLVLKFLINDNQDCHTHFYFRIGVLRIGKISVFYAIFGKILLEITG